MWPINTLASLSQASLWHPGSHHVSFVFKIYKPRTRLQPGDTYKTKPQLAVELIQELQHWGFRFSVVITDSLYDESGDCISELENLHLTYVVAIRSNHGVWPPPGKRVRYTRLPTV